MRHVRLTCKNHPALRWTCKSIAFTPGVGYNQMRNLFPQGEGCPCQPSLLVIAPEDPWGGLTADEQRAAINKDVGG